MSFLLYQSLIFPISFPVQAWSVYGVFVTVVMHDGVNVGPDLAHGSFLERKGLSWVCSECAIYGQCLPWPVGL